VVVVLVVVPVTEDGVVIIMEAALEDAVGV